MGGARGGPRRKRKAHSEVLYISTKSCTGCLLPGGFTVVILMTELSCHYERARNTFCSEPLTFDYLTDSRMHFGWRLLSNMKDAIAYFGCGYVLLASLVGLPSHTGLALSLGKRTREILLGLPGLLYLHLSERAGANAVRAASR